MGIADKGKKVKQGKGLGRIRVVIVVDILEKKARKEDLTKQDGNWIHFLKKVRETSMKIAEENQRKKATTKTNGAWEWTGLYVEGGAI